MKSTINLNEEVIVKVGDGYVRGIVEKIEWEFSQYIYFINGEWHLESHVFQTGTLAAMINKKKQ